MGASSAAVYHWPRDEVERHHGHFTKPAEVRRQHLGEAATPTY